MENVKLAAHAANNTDGFAKINLSMARWMRQRNKLLGMSLY